MRSHGPLLLALLGFGSACGDVVIAPQGNGASGSGGQSSQSSSGSASTSTATASSSATGGASCTLPSVLCKYKPSPQTECDTCPYDCIDITTNPTHCGSCATPCNGQCSGGICTPYTVLASGLHGPRVIAVDDEFVYWASHNGQDLAAEVNSVGRVPKVGGLPTTLASQQLPVRRIALDDAFVYWAAAGRVMRVAKQGGTPETLADTKALIIGLTVDSTSVYWAENDTLLIRKIAKSGGSPVTLTKSNGYPGGLAMDSGHLYWPADTTLNRMPLDGGSVTPLITGVVVRALAVTGTSLFWSDWGDSSGLRKLSTTGGTAETLAPAWGDALAVDSKKVYFTGDGSSYANVGVSAVPLDGAPLTILAHSPIGLGALALDDAYIYWATTALDSGFSTDTSGLILRIPK